MRTIIQRVSSASVSYEGEKQVISEGLCVFAAWHAYDDDKSIDYVLNKIVNMRIFPDSDHKLNLSIKDVDGEILFISNFTLYADTKHGRRPSFSFSAPAFISEPLYEKSCIKLKEIHSKVKFGKFGADMLVDIQNDGPITLIVESEV